MTYYRVLYEDIVIAESMTLETALLIKALCENLSEEPTGRYTIEWTAEEGKA